MSFKVWLKSFEDVEHSFTELARVVLNDSDFPESNDFQAMLDYANQVEELNSITLEEAIEEYKKQRK